METGSAKKDLAGHLSTILQISADETGSSTNKNVFGADEDESTKGTFMHPGLHESRQFSHQSIVQTGQQAWPDQHAHEASTIVSR